jgi:carbohydrate kinase (thermoresistant glucokinase family)
MTANSKPLVLVLMGVSGCGKSTTGTRLSKMLNWPFRDADSFHPQANVDKMSKGLPLTDEDRQPWLAAIAHWIDERLAEQRVRHRLVLGPQAGLSPRDRR